MEKPFFLLLFLELKNFKLIDLSGKAGVFFFAGLVLTLPSYLATFLYAFSPWKFNGAKENVKIIDDGEKNDCVCIYTTNNEHDAQLMRIGLEGEGIKVILQTKSDAEAPNSFIHKLELYVFERDKNKAIELLSKIKSQQNS